MAVTSARDAVIASCGCGCGQTPAKGMRFVSGHNAAKKPLVNPNPSGLCQCGCGNPTPIAKATRTSAGKVKGFPTQFLTGHYRRYQKSMGLVLSSGPDGKPRWRILCRNGKQEYFARAVVECSIGRELLPGETVHHVNGDQTDDRPENLMLFSSHSEHIKYELATGQRQMPIRWPKREES